MYDIYFGGNNKKTAMVNCNVMEVKVDAYEMRKRTGSKP